MGQMNSQITDSLGGIKTVKSFANEKGELDKFSDINDRYLDTKKDSYKFIASFNAAKSMFQGVLYSVTIVGGGFCVANSYIDVTELAIFALYIGIFISPIEVLVNFVETFQKGYAGFKRFMEIMLEVPDVIEKTGAITVSKDIKTNIEYKDVVFSYVNKQEKSIAISGLNLSIKQGEKLALVGPSGQGKSTICSLLPRFYDVDSGVITIDGTDVKDFKIDSLRKIIGIVQQDPYLFDGSLYQNISYGIKDAKFEDVVRAAKSANIHEFIETLPNGYNTKVGERGARLSGGQKQRISIARLFLRNPKIIILDEATSALDNETEAIVQASLEKLCKDRTSIIIAHRLSTIKSVDNIAVIHQDKVAEYGTHEQLMKKQGIYSKYYNLQFQ